MSFSRVHGWSATPDDRDLQKARVSFLASQNPTFHVSDPQPPTNDHRLIPEGFDYPRPASSSAILSPDAEFLNEQFIDADERRGEPNWVARPRNEFILFRCEFVRQHSGEAKRLNRASSQDPEKTLSKQAADAWHCLSSQERLYWKEQANCERVEHARRYPDYRYRPRKNLGHKRSTRSLSIQPPRSDHSHAGTSKAYALPTQQSLQSRLSVDSRGGSSRPTGRRRALSVPGFVTGSQRPVHAELVELSPPSSAPPLKVSFEPEEYQLSVDRPPALNRYRSTPMMGPLGAINPRKTESMMSTAQPYYPSQPQWNNQEQSSPDSSFMGLSSLSLMDNSNISNYATGGEPLHLTFLDCQPNEGTMWLPPLYSSATSSSSGALSPPRTPVLRSSFAYELPTDTGIQTDSQQMMPCTEQSGVATPSNHQLLFLGEDTSNFFNPEF